MSIGILAYGSLIDNPGEEISPLIVDRITCQLHLKLNMHEPVDQEMMPLL